jgi:hypothetical protein
VDTINELVRISDGLFIFAATVCRFLQDCDVSLDVALSSFLPHSKGDHGLLQNDHSTAGGTTWFLDQMYDGILKRSHAPVHGWTGSTNAACNPVKDLLGAISALNEPLSTTSLASLLNMTEYDVSQHLSRLHSVIRIRPGKDQPIRLFHSSFRDFLFDPKRSGGSGFNINLHEVHCRMLQCSFAVMESALRQDICKTVHPGTFAAEVPRTTIEACIPGHVRYACQHWVQHFAESKGPSSAILTFLQQHLLHWLEAMSWIGRTPEAISSLQRLALLVIVSARYGDGKPIALLIEQMLTAS